MLVSDSHSFVFLAIPKTGTRSAYKVLSEEPYNGVNMGDHRHIKPRKYRNYFTFTFVRNPYERMFSLYWSCCIRDGDVKGFVEEMKQLGLENTFLNFLKWVDLNKDTFREMNQSKYIILKTQSVFFKHNRIDRVIKMENIDHEINTLPFIESFIQMPRNNASKYTSIKSYFCNKSLHIINDYCSAEFDLLHYDKIHDVDQLDFL